jgi:hypothetical protein
MTQKGTTMTNEELKENLKESLGALLHVQYNESKKLIDMELRNLEEVFMETDDSHHVVMAVHQIRHYHVNCVKSSIKCIIGNFYTAFDEIDKILYGATGEHFNCMDMDNYASNAIAKCSEDIKKELSDL